MLDDLPRDVTAADARRATGPGRARGVLRRLGAPPRPAVELRRHDRLRDEPDLRPVDGDRRAARFVAARLEADARETQRRRLAVPFETRPAADVLLVVGDRPA